MLLIYTIKIELEMITKFKKYLLEARIEDDFKLIGKNILLSTYQNREFIKDCDFLKYIVLEKLGDKVIKILWNDNTKHSIVVRIKKRTNCKSISEFNDILENMLIDLFSNHFYELEKDCHIYNIFSLDKNISILININYKKLFEENTSIIIKTIINGMSSNVDKIIEIT